MEVRAGDANTQIFCPYPQCILALLYKKNKDEGQLMEALVAACAGECRVAGAAADARHPPQGAVHQVMEALVTACWRGGPSGVTGGRRVLVAHCQKKCIG